MSAATASAPPMKLVNPFTLRPVATPPVVVEGDGLELSEPLRRHATLRATLAVARLRAAVSRVRVCLRDTNGPRKRGIDKLCRVEVALRGGGRIVVARACADAYDAVSAVTDRVRRVLDRRRVARRARAMA